MVSIPLALFFAFGIVLVFAMGASVGSFLNVLTDRLPRGKSFLGRSHCDHCKKILSPIELIPIISFLIQKGRSRCCNKPLSHSYSSVEVMTGILFVLTLLLSLKESAYFYYIITYSLVIPSQTDTPNFIFHMVLIWILLSASIAISLIDIELHLIPDVLQVVIIVTALIYTYFWGQWGEYSVLSGLVVALPILFIYLVTRGKGMGFGDVVLEIGLGIWLGAAKGLLGVYLGFLFGSVFGIVLILMKKAGRRTHIAFGPFLLAGAWVSYFAGTPILMIVKKYLGF